MIRIDNESVPPDGHRPEADHPARPADPPGPAPTRPPASRWDRVRIAGSQFAKGALVYAGMVALSAALHVVVPPVWEDVLPGTVKVSVKIIRCPETPDTDAATIAPSGKEAEAVTN
ncbi:hypothetical protein [Streptomyces abyssomicinicus]|uniref:hypothetical protein n=1 Tax=Streptomyces abyssomicinicus TaxID=574929 RepID=UPI0013E020AB|nr:hypothetical protein [Streptomyces abyssomicinicus]